jgi:hypothetical protein
MAEPTFNINGGSNIPGVIAEWERIPKRKRTDGTIDYQPWARHVWTIPQATMSDFETWQGLSGDVLTSLDTTTLNDRNNGAQYTSVEVGMVTCEHIGLRAVNIRIEFRVDVS